jgi:hypothetical protein
VLGIVAPLLSIAMGVAAVAPPGVAGAGTTALIMGGSGLGNPKVITDLGLHVPMPNYIPNVEKYYIAPNSTCDPDTCDLVAVNTPEGLLPPIIGNITFDPSVAAGVQDLRTALQNQLADHPDDQVVIFAYSQSGDIVTKTLRNFVKDPATAPPTDQVSFVVAGDTNRPNGGILSRFPGLYIPILNLTFDGAAPTNTGYHTTDIAFEYDPVSDFPEYPLDLLADLNSLIAFLDVHATYPNPYLPLPQGIPLFPTALPDRYTAAELHAAMNDPANRQTYGDTTYITIPTKNLPLLDPFRDLAADTHTTFLFKPILDLIQPVLRVLVDLGYDRSVPYGQPTPAGLFPRINPQTLLNDLGDAVRQGVQDALADMGINTRKPATAQTNVTATGVSISSAQAAAGSTTSTAKAPNIIHTAIPASAPTTASLRRKVQPVITSATPAGRTASTVGASPAPTVPAAPPPTPKQVRTAPMDAAALHVALGHRGTLRS